MSQNRLFTSLFLFCSMSCFCQKVTEHERVYSNHIFIDDSNPIYNENNDTLIFITDPDEGRDLKYFPHNFTNHDTTVSIQHSTWFDEFYYRWRFQSKSRGASIERYYTIKGKGRGFVYSFDVDFSYVDILGINCLVFRYNDDLYIYRLVKYEKEIYGNEVFYYVQVGNKSVVKAFRE